MKKGKVHIHHGTNWAEVTDKDGNSQGVWSGVGKSNVEDVTQTKVTSKWELDDEANGFTASVEY